MEQMRVLLIWFSTPAFGSAWGLTPIRAPTDRSRSVHFPEGLGYRNREGIAPPENDLGGLRRWPRLDYRGFRRGLPLMPFPAASPSSGGLRREKGMNGTSRRRSWALLVSCVTAGPAKVEFKSQENTKEASCSLESPSFSHFAH